MTVPYPSSFLPPPTPLDVFSCGICKGDSWILKHKMMEQYCGVTLLRWLCFFFAMCVFSVCVWVFVCGHLCLCLSMKVHKMAYSSYSLLICLLHVLYGCVGGFWERGKNKPSIVEKKKHWNMSDLKVPGLWVQAGEYSLQRQLWMQPPRCAFDWPLLQTGCKTLLMSVPIRF